MCRISGHGKGLYEGAEGQEQAWLGELGLARIWAWGLDQCGKEKQALGQVWGPNKMGPFWACRMDLDGP